MSAADFGTLKPDMHTVIETVCIPEWSKPLESGSVHSTSSLDAYKENPMLVTFSTNVYADITLFGDIALTLLKLMGHSGTIPGAIPEEDVPAALSRLRAAVGGQVGLATPTGDKSGDEDEPSVSLKNRALPLIELLDAAAKAKTYVTWK